MQRKNVGIVWVDKVQWFDKIEKINNKRCSLHFFVTSLKPSFSAAKLNILGRRRALDDGTGTTYRKYKKNQTNVSNFTTLKIYLIWNWNFSYLEVSMRNTFRDQFKENCIISLALITISQTISVSTELWFTLRGQSQSIGQMLDWDYQYVVVD